MTEKIYSIKDTKIGFGQPFTMINNAVAIRAFSNMAQAEQPNQVNTYPEDKELWELGEFDTETGKIKAIEPKYINKALDFKEKA